MVDPLVEYKNSVEKRLNDAELLINRLIHENSVKDQLLEQRDEEISQLKATIEKLDEKSSSQLKKYDLSLENLDIIKDLFEYLCGVRVHKTYEDDTGLWFDTSQGVKDSNVMDYKLGFVKNSASPKDNSTNVQVVYVPLLKYRSPKELLLLQKILPEYMFETLQFPLSSLHQFYMKLSKCLDKK
ncbi:hypothetical protein TBLA_0F00530 [Henningerozyma blattae CBS 6284]|uniref:Monopolin complex subunit Csm1/Pcs1 C-terminal domain-containing protein n=1 Tax=Henningerozyma blattae (strain ATCC 34711 / CBS 6284 / DSM 70876 / NBRC 10599 / NRRL Y-10934 / UCD 77-7) TaxID=1071380 RepID=I2H5E5_HENB6|nr:hypothetical protein TBLA_0F00530 [Tetrapisispora blattae CBS 6284]CCH61597.1 hypothetical protein TBLA_0F00530 [Tetrapisispora blattae CBS 6284]